MIHDLLIIGGVILGTFAGLAIILGAIIWTAHREANASETKKKRLAKERELAREAAIARNHGILRLIETSKQYKRY